jgi:hypothetical protein
MTADPIFPGSAACRLHLVEPVTPEVAGSSPVDPASLRSHSARSRSPVFARASAGQAPRARTAASGSGLPAPGPGAAAGAHALPPRWRSASASRSRWCWPSSRSRPPSPASLDRRLPITGADDSCGRRRFPTAERQKPRNLRCERHLPRPRLRVRMRRVGGVNGRRVARSAAVTCNPRVPPKRLSGGMNTTDWRAASRREWERAWWRTARPASPARRRDHESGEESDPGSRTEHAVAAAAAAGSSARGAAEPDR